VFYTTVFRDGAGETFAPLEVVERVSAAANAPTYGFFDQYVGRGIVGGNVISLSAHAVEMAKLALRVLAGTTEASAPQVAEVATNKLLFDWRQLQRWGISESKLPAGSEIWFRESSVWEQYKPQILAIIAAILAQALLIAWLIHERQYRRRAERTARETFSELTHMNRMATAGELSAAIAHEIRQPITGMVTMANAALRWLSREKPDIGRAQAAMNKVVAAGHQASDVITNVRGLFGKDTQEETPTDLNTLIQSVLELVSIDLRKHNIESQVNLSQPLPLVVGNEVQLQQVILNLVINAIESMNSAEPRVLSIKSETTGHNGVRVSIADTGTGVDLANLNRLFKPMFTTKARGMGMGLSICKSIIESHHGRIWATAGAPRGSIFQFELPISGTTH
jgi:C4-dicarboxylate-specific signal transduction histidine kinase